jgi:hypothetical protein
VINRPGGALSFLKEYMDLLLTDRSNNKFEKNVRAGSNVGDIGTLDGAGLNWGSYQEAGPGKNNN